MDVHEWMDVNKGKNKQHSTQPLFFCLQFCQESYKFSQNKSAFSYISHYETMRKTKQNNYVSSTHLPHKFTTQIELKNICSNWINQSVTS